MKNTIQNIKENIKLVIGVLIFGLLLGWIFFHSSGDAPKTNTEISGHEGHDHESSEPTVWTCSMHPQIKQDKPGLCPICAMDLIPLTTMSSGGDDVDPNEIVMSESAANLASIQTMIVTMGVPEKTVYLQGKVQADERNISELTSRFGGRIEKLFVNFTGQKVEKGEKLATIYSPGLVTAQRELLEAVSFKESRPSLYTAAKGKLKLWDLNDEQIAAIEEKGEPQLYFDVLSPISGTVSKRHVTIGDYVKEGTGLFEIIDLSKVWIMFDAYESDLPWIKKGDPVNISIQALPGKNFDARITFIDPFIEAITRVAKVRVEIVNKNHLLKPEMFANGIIESGIGENTDQVLIPKSSILWTGKRAVVYVKVPDRESPSFLYREIVLGPEAGAFYVVNEGLEEGEEIAVNGVFKIDAASQLQGLPSMMNPGGGKVSIGHNHGDAPMNDKKMENMDNPDSPTVDMSAETPLEFKMQLNDVVEKYLLLKDAFVATDASEAEKAARTTLDALNKVDMSLLSPGGYNQWIKLQKPIKDNLSGIIQMQGVEMKRSHFSIVSDNLIKAIEIFGTPEKESPELYIQFCPMAFDDKGAYWISNKQEIRNPYFGDVMLKCGEVKKELKQ
ncbi:MAG: efflux RND transporter periplasmic adaptor subunit [Bacteroidales bacterium]|nr:efflux RND transporter periplasmic adaptor subunit [Bacteroidales bacterium]MCF8404572.1 efflux RND transporter periplasmic adaptor subunit [Bacteroidales bacterium]